MNASSIPKIGRCTCGATVFGDSFRDRESYLEFLRTGRNLCQRCQDEIFLAGNPDDPHHRRFPIVDGALAAVRGVLGETCLLPFRLVSAPRARIAFEARFIVRAGPSLKPLDPWDELDPMRDLLDGHQVRVHEHTCFDTPEVAERVSPLSILIALDRPALVAACSACPPLSRLSTLSLEDAVPWRTAFARPLRPLRGWSSPGHEPSSALRECALMGLALLERDTAGRRALDHLVASNEALFHHPRPA